MKHYFIKVCMLTGLTMPLFPANMMAAGSPQPNSSTATTGSRYCSR